MARKRPPEKRKQPVGKLSPDTIEPLAQFFGDILFELMIGMIKADSVEADFARIREDARRLTKEQIRRVADLAGRYYAEHANSSPANLSRDRCAILKRQALEFALNQLENETNFQE